MDYIRRGANLSSVNAVVMVFVCISILINDYSDFIVAEARGSKITIKIIFGVLLFVAIVALISSVQKMNARVSEMIHYERKALRKQNRKSLNVFKTKIISHVRATPADFAKILTN